jgi:dolichol-phosphate mannosyltransferase
VRRTTQEAGVVDEISPVHRAPTAGGAAIDVVMPAHNEGRTIGETLREFHRVVVALGLAEVRFIVSEDGSTDDTREVVRATATDVPVRLFAYPERKGYSRAVIDGSREATAPLVCFVDSDGQCDPADLPTLVAALDGNDMVVGYRDPRVDALSRKVMSAAFRFLYQRLFPVRLKDPSCPYVLVRRDRLEVILRGHPGILRQGFWWEFNARGQAAGLAVVQVPVHHRVRAAGDTQIYLTTKLPRIALEHVRGLFTLRRELRTLAEVPVDTISG